VLPGERYSVLVNSDERFSGNATINYFNLNTEETENAQYPKIDIDYALNITEFEDVSLVLFPNPTNGMLHIVSFEKSEELRILDINGSVLLQKFNISKEEQIDLSSFGTGLYFVQLKQSQKIITKKITLN
jgi:hypothetical protein